MPGAESVSTKDYYFFFPPSRRIGGWMSTDHRLCLVPSILTFPRLDDFFPPTCFLLIIEIYTLAALIYVFKGDDNVGGN